MDRKNQKELFCSQTASYGYDKVSVRIPLFESTLEKNNDLIRVLGVKEVNTFAPGDMELDSRFAMLGEWRDYRKLKNTRQKDAVLSSIFEWMNNKNYKFDPKMKVEAKSLFAYLIRHTDINIMKVESQVPKNMSLPLMAAVQTLNRISDKLQSYLETREQIFYQKNHRFFTHRESMQVLEDYRKIDFEKSSRNQSNDFHSEFHN